MTAIASSIGRIELSRARLRLAMTPPPLPAPGTPVSYVQTLLDRIQAVPTVRLVIDTLRGWWVQHPLHAVALVAGEASNAVAKPLAQRHPLGIVLAAALIGAALAWSRPWRWILKPALFAGLLPQLVSRVVTTLPIESWVNVLNSTLAGSPPARTPAA